jgi:hypothetical protein
MRRPTRIKSEDFDVPPLTESDFEIEALPGYNQLLGAECALIRDVEMQRELAIMCIEKAKLCMFIGDMLKVQYSVLSRSGVQADQTINSTHMLLPNKNPENMGEVERVDKELLDWFASLPECCQHRPLDSVTITDENKVLAVQRNLLHMIYHTTISALHRPLFLPASPTEGPSTPVEVQETARQRVREAAEHITCMAAELRRRGLERYLPTTGVTVILPAMIVHMLDTKSLVPETRAKAVLGLRECLTVMSNLRNIYAAADFATGFLDALLRKGMLGGPPQQLQPQPQPQAAQPPSAARSGKVLNRALAPTLNLAPQGQGLGVVPGMGMMPPTVLGRPTTPPPENATGASSFLHSADVENPSPFGYTTTQTLVPGDRVTVPIPARAVGAATPPHTDSEDVATPSHSTQDRDQDIGDADVAMADQIMLEYTTLKADGGVGTATGAATGNNFDFDQWLQFPAEGGLNTTDNDTFMGGMFGCEQAGMDLGGDHGWIGNLPEGISH